MFEHNALQSNFSMRQRQTKLTSMTSSQLLKKVNKNFIWIRKVGILT